MYKRFPPIQIGEEMPLQKQQLAEASGRRVHCLSAGIELVSWAQIQLFAPLHARLRVVASLSPRASLALLCRLMGN
ncbi:hypothetical protein NQZ68_010786 [Dissostichus eleginoides]|nr:hypothetical protein NQZ68_010786 [Dissostichus eleginoides]